MGDPTEENFEQDDTRLEVTPRPWPLTDARSNSVHDAIEDVPGGNSRMDVSPEVNINSVRSEATLTSNDRDVLGDVNQRTQGTEFYGTASNYVLLNQLFSHVRQHSLAMRTPDAGQPVTSPNQGDHGPAGRMSLVNLLAHEDDLLPPSREKSPLPTISSATRSSAFRALPNGHQSVNRTSSSVSPASNLRVTERRLEKALIRSFMHNLHYLHPMIEPGSFTNRSPQLRHFFALYNIIVAVGALVAGSELSDELNHEIKTVLHSKKDP
ncbi:hypothetical protein KCU77_g16861, partial [Aureobasidium melanogenum]